MKKIIYKNSVDDNPAELDKNENNQALLKPNNRYKLKPKGTVLYTVVTVMMILLIFVLVTLGISATANKRAYNTYSKNQTYYSAKSLVESVVDGLTDKSNTSDKTSLKGVVGNIGDSTQTLAVGTEITSGSKEYRLPNGMGVLKGGVKIIPSGTDQTGTENFVEGTGKPILKVEATVELGGQESTYSRYVHIGITPGENSDMVDPGFVSLGGMSNTSVGHSAVGGVSSMVYGHQFYVPENTHLNPRDSLVAIDDIDPDDLDSIALENAKANAISLNKYLVYNSNVGMSDNSYYRISPEGGLVFNGHLVPTNNFTINGIYKKGLDKVSYEFMPWVYVRGTYFSRSGNNTGYSAKDGNVTYGPLNIIAGQVSGNNQNSVQGPFQLAGGYGLRGVLPTDFYSDVYMMNKPDDDYLTGTKLNFTEDNKWDGQGAKVNGGLAQEAYMKGVSVIGTDGNTASGLLDWTSDLVNKNDADAHFGNWYSEGSMLYYMLNSDMHIYGDTIIKEKMLTFGTLGNGSAVIFHETASAQGGLVMLDNPYNGQNGVVDDSRANITAEKGIFVNVEESLFKGGLITVNWENDIPTPKSYLIINGVQYAKFEYDGYEYSTCATAESYDNGMAGKPYPGNEGDYENAWKRAKGTTVWTAVTDINEVKAAFISAANLAALNPAPVVSDPEYAIKLAETAPPVDGETYIDYIKDRVSTIKNSTEEYFSPNGLDVKAVVTNDNGTENIFYKSDYELDPKEVKYTAPILWMAGESGDQDVKNAAGLSAEQKEVNATSISSVAVYGETAENIIRTKFGVTDGGASGSSQSVKYDSQPMVIVGDVTLTSPRADNLGMASRTLYVDPTYSNKDIYINLVNWQTSNESKIVVCNSADGINATTNKVTFYVPATPDELRTERRVIDGSFGNEYFGSGGGNGADKDTDLYEKDGNFDNGAQRIYILTSYYDKQINASANIELAEYPDDRLKVPNIFFQMNGDGDFRVQNFLGVGYFRMPYSYFGFRDGVADVDIDYFLNTDDEDVAEYDKTTGPIVNVQRPHIIGSMVVGSFDLGNKSENTGGSTGNQMVVVYVSPRWKGEVGGSNSGGSASEVNEIVRVMD
jgi:hypothetical protein